MEGENRNTQVKYLKTFLKEIYSITFHLYSTAPSSVALTCGFSFFFFAAVLWRLDMSSLFICNEEVLLRLFEAIHPWVRWIATACVECWVCGSSHFGGWNSAGLCPNIFLKAQLLFQRHLSFPQKSDTWLGQRLWDCFGIVKCQFVGDQYETDSEMCFTGPHIWTFCVLTASRFLF